MSLSGVLYCKLRYTCTDFYMYHARVAMLFCTLSVTPILAWPLPCNCPLSEALTTTDQYIYPCQRAQRSPRWLGAFTENFTECRDVALVSLRRAGVLIMEVHLGRPCLSGFWLQRLSCPLGRRFLAVV